ncbi:MAG TPA: hypothetical protein VF712_14450 [Thermoleophilaceae bacterium]|jgi:hypothetical protein
MTAKRAAAALAAVSLVVVPAAGGATKSPVRKSATYTGKTSQGEVCRHGDVDGRQCDVKLRTSKDAKKVATLTIRWRGGPCSDNPNRYYRAATDYTNVPISKARFKHAGSYDATLSDGTKATNEVTLNGKFKRSSKGKYSASGDFSVVADLVLPDGTKTHCESGKVTWSAKLVK